MKTFFLSVGALAVSGLVVFQVSQAEDAAGPKLKKPKVFVAPPGQGQSQAEEDVIAPDAGAAGMRGSFVGMFGTNKITVAVERVAGQSVLGYSVVAGNERAFSGAWTLVAGAYEVVAREPGDDKEDGVFHFVFRPEAPGLLAGDWKPNSRKLQAKSFSLARRVFKYDATAGDYPESSTHLLKEKDVENMSQEELRLMRNEIYARHGYCFHTADMREHFDAQEWYMPVSVDVTAQLTKIEEKNAEMLKRYESYAAKYYDAFGR